MKPLTIEQLKALEVGDWVWVVDFSKTVYKPISDCGAYAQIQSIEGTRFHVWGRGLAECEMFEYVDCGTKWLAYKNKEQAEAKGEIVELPCLREVEIFGCKKYHVYFVNDKDPWKNVIDYVSFDTKSEAERRLAELKGEKE